MFHGLPSRMTQRFILMPIDAGIAGALGGVMPGPKDFFNVGSTLFTNWQQKKYADQAYKRQRADSIEFWNMQNAYNTPEAQMQRFKDAGLNPHLIYGQGNGGNAAPIPTPDTMPVNFREPRLDTNSRNGLAEALMLQADLKIKNAQADNLTVQNEVIRQDAALRRFQAERAGYDLDFERKLTDVSADARRENLRKTRTEIDIMTNRDAREAALNSSNIQEASQRMLTLIEQRKGMPLERGRVAADIDRIRQNIAIMEKEGILKDFEIALRQQGINPNDPLWARYVGMFLSDVYDGKLTPSTIAGSIWKWILK